MVWTTKQRRDAVPASRSRSTASTIRLRALSAPTDSSALGMLLSMEAGSRMVGMPKAGDGAGGGGVAEGRGRCALGMVGAGVRDGAPAAAYRQRVDPVLLQAAADGV